VVLLMGCVSPLASLRHASSLPLGATKAVVRYDEPATGALVERCLLAAQPPLARWGSLVAPLTLHVVGDHQQLEEATHHRAGWLKAWARYDEVVLQAPRSWSSSGASEAEVTQLLTHELTHCVLFQHAGDAQTWRRREIPLWFREGMATVTAGQGREFPSLETLARWLEAHPALDVFGEAEALAVSEFEVVYGLSHQAFSFLLKRYGDEAVRGVIARMRAGASFDQAFEAGVGVVPAVFLAEVKTWLTLRGFRGQGTPVNVDLRERLKEDLKAREREQAAPGGPSPARW
jgi:hypothetical protein